jgi:transcriptional regulator with XRE-family HTH domain
MKMSQRVFAKVIGLSPSMLQKIELGKRGLTERVTEAVMVRFGIEPESLKGTDPLSLLGNRFGSLADSIRYWDKFCETFSRSAFNNFKDTIKPKLEILLEAAKKEKKEIALYLRLDRWIETVAKEFGLEFTITNASNNRRKNRDGANWISFVESLGSAGFVAGPAGKGVIRELETTGRTGHRTVAKPSLKRPKTVQPGTDLPETPNSGGGFDGYGETISELGN